MLIGQDRFAGQRPRIVPHLLRQFEAQKAINCDLSKGNLKPFRNYTKGENLIDGVIKTIYDWKLDGTHHWISSTRELNFARSPVSDEAHSRVYVTGMEEPRVLSTSELSFPFDFETDFYKLGVPAPESALTIDSGYTVGSGYRAYIYTYVVVLNGSDAEEGINSAIASVSDYGSGNVTLSGFAAPPSNRSIGKIRVYRTSATTSGAADFRYVGEFSTVGVDFDTFTFTDDVAEASLGEVIPTTTFTPPPQALKGITALKNGSLVGFVGKRVYFSEPYLPHAWPYNYPLDANIVGIGLIGSNIVVMTDENVYFLEGPPEAISDRKLEGRYPCVSARGIVSCEAGVIFPSDTGIALVTLDGVRIYSLEYLEEEQYSHQYAPSTIRAEFYDNKYFACYDGGIMVFDLREKYMIEIKDPFPVSAIHYSLEDRKLYFAGPGDDDNDNALYIFKENYDDSFTEYTYRSKDYLFSEETNMAACKIQTDPSVIDNPDNITANQDAVTAGDHEDGLVNVPLVNDLGAIPNYDAFVKTYSATIKFYANGSLIHTETLTDTKTFRLPSKNKYRRFYYEVTGDLPIVEIKIATSMEELTGLL
jgi:hypothetical protein